MKFLVVVDLKCWKNSFHLVGKKQETKSYIWIRIQIDQILIIFYVFKISYFSYFFNYVSILPNPPTHYVSKHKHLANPPTHYFAYVIFEWSLTRCPWSDHEILWYKSCTGYSFWDRLHNFLPKLTWIVLLVHKLNKLCRFW